MTSQELHDCEVYLDQRAARYAEPELARHFWDIGCRYLKVFLTVLVLVGVFVAMKP